MSMQIDFKNQPVNPQRAHFYNFLVSSPALRFEYNGDGNSFSISPIRLDGGVEVGTVLLAVHSLFYPAAQDVSVYTRFMGPDEKDLDRDFALGQPSTPLRPQGTQSAAGEGNTLGVYSEP